MLGAEKPTVLLVDDEERILRSLAMLLRPHYRLFTTTDARAALELVRREAVHVVVSDQRMPVMLGAELLRQVRAISPHTMRILLTGYSELESVVASVNEGEIFRFINKPWDSAELRATVQQAAGISTALRASITHEADATRAAPATALLVIDDDLAVAQVVRELAGAERPVLWAQSVDHALRLLESAEVGVIVSELNVGGQNVAPLLKLLKAQHPEVVTLVMTPFQDTRVFIGLINQGQVFRFLPKPVRRNLLSMSLDAALKRHAAMNQAPALRAAHAVQALAADEASMAGRISGFLARLRNRLVPRLEPGSP